MISGISEKNRKILDDLNRKINGPFSAKEAFKILNIPLKETSLLLTYFVTKGWLSRIRRGVYSTIPLGTINPQEYRENPLVVANKVFEPCYIGGWSAAEHWEYTDQIFNSVVVFSYRRFRNRTIKMQGVDYIIKYLDKKYFTVSGIKPVWVNNQKINMSDPAQTIVDILYDPTIGGGMRNVSDIVQAYFSFDKRNDDVMVDLIEKRGNKSVYKRLGYLIEELNIEADDLMKKCKKLISAGFTLLDPTVENRGRYNTKWNLRINIRIDK